MTKKKKGGNGNSAAGAKKQDGKKNVEKDVEAKQLPRSEREDIKELAIPTALQSKRGKSSEKVYETWNTIKDSLRICQRDQELAKQNSADSAPMYDIPVLKADSEMKKGLYRQALATETVDGSSAKPNGKSDQAKATKATWKAAENALKEATAAIKNKGLEAEKCRDMHNAITIAQQRLEDFLYYQDTMRRWARRRVLYPGKRAKAEQERMKRKIAYKLDSSGDDTGHFGWLCTLLELYDERQIGGQFYKQGFDDALGNRILSVRQNGAGIVPTVRPDDFHLWTPRNRRQTTGLPRDSDDTVTSLGKVTEEDDLGAWEKLDRVELPALEFIVDTAALDSVARKIETSPHGTVGTSHQSHLERRTAEVEYYRGGDNGVNRPSTSFVREVGRSDGCSTFDDRWRELQDTGGRFLAAKETSWDWLTSYDCLGPVKCGQIADIRANSDKTIELDPLEIDEQGSRHMKGNIPVGEEALEADAGLTSGPPETGLAGLTAEPTPLPKKSSKKRKRSSNEDTIKESERARKITKTKENAIEGHSSESKQPDESGEPKDPKAPFDDAWKHVKADLTYLYPPHEFCRSPKRYSIGEGTYITTAWAEETTGRRERHTYRFHDHSSPVNSPPQSPRAEEVEENSFPIGFSKDNVRARDIEESGSRRKCGHNAEGCRAWWTHPPIECWLAYTERPTRPEADVQWPIPEIDAPKDLIDDYIPKQVVPIYRARQDDNYGILYPYMDNVRPSWPRIGIRVPYEPMTFDDMRLHSAQDDPEHHHSKHRHAGVAKPGSNSGANEDTSRKSQSRTRSEAIRDETERCKRTNVPDLGLISAKDWKERTAHEMRSMAMPIIAKPDRPYGWYVWDDPQGGEIGNKLSEDDDQSDSEGDIFRASYLRWSSGRS